MFTLDFWLADGTVVSQLEILQTRWFAIVKFDTIFQGCMTVEANESSKERNRIH